MVGEQRVGLDVHGEAGPGAVHPHPRHLLGRRVVVRRVGFDDREDRGVIAEAFLGVHGPPRVEVALLDERLVGPGTGPDQDAAGVAPYRRPTLGFLPWLALFRRHFSFRLLVFLLIGT